MAREGMPGGRQGGRPDGRDGEGGGGGWRYIRGDMSAPAEVESSLGRRQRRREAQLVKRKTN